MLLTRPAVAPSMVRSGVRIRRRTIPMLALMDSVNPSREPRRFRSPEGSSTPRVLNPWYPRAMPAGTPSTSTTAKPLMVMVISSPKVRTSFCSPAMMTPPPLR